MACALVVSAGLGSLAGCGGPSTGGGSGESVGKAEIAITGVPADGTCIQVVATGYRTVTRNFDAQVGATSVFEIPGLPLGQVTFTASAFGGACPPAAGTVANWISDAPFTATVAVDPPVLVTLNLVRDGNADVSIGFNDGADGGASTDGGTTTGADAGSTPSNPVFMVVAGVSGGATLPLTNTDGAFALESFRLSASTPSSAAAGSGAGASKTTWTATATLKYQDGVPDLYGAAATGKVEKTVTVSTFSSGSNPILLSKATLTNVVISSIADGAAGVVPDLTITFAFTRIDLEYDGARNADGTAAPATRVSFNLQTGAGGGSTVVPLQFVVGAQGVTGFESASAFTAPSETTPVSTGGATGAGAGKASFSDASLTIPLDGSSLEMLADEVAGRNLPTAAVQIEAADATGDLQVFGTYGFKNVQIHAMTFTGTSATLSFGAASFAWTANQDMVSFP